MYYQQICSDVRDIAKKVGEYLISENQKLKQEDVQNKGLNDFVTYVDKTAEKMIVDELSKIIIDAGFITEEKTLDYVESEFEWIIDPLDGTANYIHGLSPYSISIALRREREVVLGVVFEVVSNEMFYAWKNGGAWLNGREISVSKVDSLKSSFLATGFPYTDFSKLDEYMDMFAYLARNTQGIRRLGSAAIDLVYVACGRFDGFYEYGLNAWDVAAGSLIVKEAGGKITDFDGGDNWLFGKTIVAGNENICHELTELCKEYFK
ncbi:MAG: inositol monophosphatase family protein [Bacteroidales bacterium]|nr:inositol monophosphatase [Bacteroidales bacterium]